MIVEVVVFTVDLFLLSVFVHLTVATEPVPTFFITRIIIILRIMAYGICCIFLIIIFGIRSS